MGITTPLHSPNKIVKILFYNDFGYSSKEHLCQDVLSPRCGKSFLNFGAQYLRYARSDFDAVFSYFFVTSSSITCIGTKKIINCLTKINKNIKSLLSLFLMNIFSPVLNVFYSTKNDIATFLLNNIPGLCVDIRRAQHVQY